MNYKLNNYLELIIGPMTKSLFAYAHIQRPESIDSSRVRGNYITITFALEFVVFLFTLEWRGLFDELFCGTSRVPLEIQSSLLLFISSPPALREWRRLVLHQNPRRHAVFLGFSRSEATQMSYLLKLLYQVHIARHRVRFR